MPPSASSAPTCPGAAWCCAAPPTASKCCAGARRWRRYWQSSVSPSLSLAGRETPVLSLQLAAAAPPDAALLARIVALVGLDDERALAYADLRRGIAKRALIDDKVLAGLALFGETAAGGWLKEAMLAGQAVDPLRNWLFLPAAAPPANLVRQRGRIVCNCQNVAETDIVAAIKAGATTREAVQERTGCGTGCGACLPELSRLLTSHRVW